MTESLNQKPDIIVKERTRMTILDIACPCDVYISETYGLTLEKYKSLLAFIEREMMPYICDVVIIRSLDIVCKNELNVMIGMRIPKTKVKFWLNGAQHQILPILVKSGMQDANLLKNIRGETYKLRVPTVFLKGFWDKQRVLELSMSNKYQYMYGH